VHPAIPLAPTRAETGGGKYVGRTAGWFGCREDEHR
jgi:hypothetical protein